jgi:hypothetical protein
MLEEGEHSVTEVTRIQNVHRATLYQALKSS